MNASLPLSIGLVQEPVPNSARKVRTIRTAVAFSSGEHRRAVDFPIPDSLP
ncbi:hypothetical protein ACX80T_10205 [Arthrobacter sp. Sr33]